MATLSRGAEEVVSGAVAECQAIGYLLTTEAPSGVDLPQEPTTVYMEWTQGKP